MRQPEPSNLPFATDLLLWTVVARGFAGEKMAFVKSGWLLWQSTILKHWKNWFDLWSDGHLICYDDQTWQSVEDKVHVPVGCINICMGHECRDIQPPDGKPKDCMLQIVGRDGKTISLCAESTGDCLAWKFTFKDYVTMLAQKSCMMRQLWLPPHLLTQTMLHQPLSRHRVWSIQWCIPTRNSNCLCCKCSGLCCTLSAPVCRTLWTAACQPRHHSREWYWNNDSDLGTGHAGWAATVMALGSLFWVF